MSEIAFLLLEVFRKQVERLQRWWWCQLYKAYVVRIVGNLYNTESSLNKLSYHHYHPRDSNAGKAFQNLKSQRKHLYTSVTKQDILSHLDHNLYDAVCITLPSQIGFFFSCLSIFPKSLGKFFHSVGKSQKKSHSILRAKRATFKVLVDKKMTILVSGTRQVNF